MDIADRLIADEADTGIEFVNRSISFYPNMVFGNACAPDELGRTSIAFPGVNFHRAYSVTHQSGSSWLWIDRVGLDKSVFQPHNPVSMLGYVFFVRNDNDGVAFLMNLFKQHHDFF